MTPVETGRRQLTHVELLYRPGERALAAQLFRLLGCEALDRDGTWFTSFIDPASRDFSNNVFYASEVGAEQWRLEEALVRNAGVERDRYVAHMRSEPQRSPHFGFRVADRSALDDLAARIRTAGLSDPDMKGRVEVDAVFEPEAPGSVAPNMVQMFVWTDIVASGLLTLGQHIEVQWHLPVS